MTPSGVTHGVVQLMQSVMRSGPELPLDMRHEPQGRKRKQLLAICDGPPPSAEATPGPANPRDAASFDKRSGMPTLKDREPERVEEPEPAAEESAGGVAGLDSMLAATKAGAPRQPQKKKGATAAANANKGSKRPRSLPISSDEHLDYKGGKIYIRGDLVKISIPAVHSKSGKEARVEHKLRKGNASQITQRCEHIEARAK